MKSQTFNGDCRDFAKDSFVGCNGRFFRPVAAEFDGQHTVISYEPVPLDEMPARYGHLVEQAEDRAYLADLFGGQW